MFITNAEEWAALRADWCSKSRIFKSLKAQDSGRKNPVLFSRTVTYACNPAPLFFFVLPVEQKYI